jgi:nucleotide-binding universal stress UspA family protein
VVTRTVRGYAADALIASAEGADLLVVGARGRGGLPGLLLGSASLTCAQRAPCPVAVVPANPAIDPGRRGRLEPGPVVVGVASPSTAGPALEFAAGEASLRGTGMVAVHAVHWPPLGTELIRPDEDDLVAWGTQLLAQTVASIRESGPQVQIEQRVIPGHPVEVLQREANGAGLLVVGRQGRGRLAGMIMGSVSLHLLTHARRPTVVVTHPGLSRAGETAEQGTA